MQLGLFRREHLGSGDPDLIGQATIDQFQRTHGALQAWAEVQHNDDGTHGAVTAASLVVAGPTLLEGDLTVEGAVAPLDFEAGGFSNDVAGVAIGPGTFNTQDEYPSGSSTADVTRAAIQLERDLIPDVDAQGYLGWLGAGAFVRRWKSLYFSNVVYGPLVVATTAFYERGRAVAVGEWQPVPFSAGNFTGSGAMTWTLTSGDQAVYQYTVIGKTIIIDFAFDTTSVGGTPSTLLMVAIPAGLTFSSASCLTRIAECLDAGTLVGAATVQVIDGTHWGFRKSDGTNWAASTNTTYVRGMFTASLG